MTYAYWAIVNHNNEPVSIDDTSGRHYVSDPADAKFWTSSNAAKLYLNTINRTAEKPYRMVRATINIESET